MAKETLRGQIARLEAENSNLHSQIDALYEKIYALQSAGDESFLASPAYKQFQRENETLKQHVQTLERRLQSAQEKNDNLIGLLEERPAPVHNARGAGRKKADEKWQERYRQWVNLHESQKSIKETCEEMSISRATHYRYLRQYESDMQ